jgi:hypothetical protein
VRRRSFVLLAAAGSLAGCTATPSAAALPSPRPAVADDYWWFKLERDLSKGFCFTWVRGLTPKQVRQRLGGTELERVYWQQLVGSGDGPREPADVYYLGIGRVGDWSLIVEDHGDLGATERFALPLSSGTMLVSHCRAADGHARFLLAEDSAIQLDFDPRTPAMLRGTRAFELAPQVTAVGFGAGDDSYTSMEATFALAERLTGIAMTQELLSQNTYLLTTVPRLSL